MSESIMNETMEYSRSIGDILLKSPFDKLEEIAYALLEARRQKQWIFIAGNGGSASTASHFANDLVKGLSIADRPRFRAKALCDAMPIVTALANDYDYNAVYTEQLKNYASPCDVLILISGSGNSPNVVNAAEYGKECGLNVISFTGRDGGRLKYLSDICCIAATDAMEKIEDIHLVWEHSLITALRKIITEEQKD